MKYTDFYNLLEKYFTGREIAGIQQIAYKEYYDAHGYLPKRKVQKQCAYAFLVDFIRNNIVDAEDCYNYLRSAGVARVNIEKFWASLNAE